MRARILEAAVLIAVLPSPLQAHDFWIEPSTFRPETGSALSAQLLVGQGFEGDPLPRLPPLIKRFVLAGPSGESPFLGLPGSDPAGYAQVQTPGLHMIGYESTPSSVEIGPEKLSVYIRDEGLEPFFGGDPTKPIRDHFSRCAKSLVLAGKAGAGAEGFDRALGFSLELIPEVNPYALGRDGNLPFRLLREGKPLEGALVLAMESRQPEKKLSARTDGTGRVRLTLPRPGLWLVKSVYITRLPGAEDEWASFWASLTFELPEPSPEARKQ